VAEKTGGGESSDGFSDFFRTQFGSVRRVTEMIVGNRAVAQEVTQDAFVEALRHWRKVSTYDQPGAWVRRVAIRRAVKVRDRRRNEPRLDPVGEAPIDVPDPDLARAVASLPRAQRAAVALYYLEDRPVAEVAQLMGCSESTVRVHLHRARHRLAAALAPSCERKD
jgi:RNA polymerase sigma factor (sigma-70 family)